MQGLVSADGGLTWDAFDSPLTDRVGAAAAWCNVRWGSGRTRNQRLILCSPQNTGEIVVAGGREGARTTQDVWAASANGTKWTLRSEKAGWPARYGHAMVPLQVREQSTRTSR